MTAIRDELSEESGNEQMLFADPDYFDAALVGYCTRFGMQPVALYDYEKYIKILMEHGSGDYSESVEYFEYNVIGRWHGENTPCFAVLSDTWKQRIADEVIRAGKTS